MSCRCRTVISMLVGLVLAAAAPAAQAHRFRSTSTPAGIGDIQWSSSSPARGVQVLDGSAYDPAVHPQWTITIQAPTVSPLDGSADVAEAGSPAWASQTETRLSAEGFAPHATVLPWPDYLGDPRGPMGVRVRVGEFATQDAAKSQAATLTTDGFAPLVEWEGYDPQAPPDAELLHAVIVDPWRFGGEVIADHGAAIASRQTVAAQAQQFGSLAAVNAGFFTIDAPLSGVAGVPTGLGVYDGQIQALANGARADLVLAGHRPATVENLTSQAWLRAGRSTTAILGVNRQPGSAEDCGVPGFTPTAASRQGVICTGADDLVLFTSSFGAALPVGAGAQATLDAHGRVLTVGARGGTVPPGGWALQGIGSDAGWLTAALDPGQRVEIREQLRGGRGHRFPLTSETSIVSAAPRLLRDGHVAIDAIGEGVFDPRDLNNYGFSAERHGRTIAGVDRAGRLILVTADGVPGVSEGLTLDEEAQLMQSLGAVDAMNLDGGGSTSFVLGGQTINHPSDATGARAVGDSIQVLP